MYGNANCLVDVRRGDEENSDGDTVQPGLRGALVYAGVPFSIIEVTQRYGTYSSLEPQTLRYPRGRCNGDLLLQEDDQIYDKTRQRLYYIITLTRGDSAVLAGEWVLQLQRVTGGAVTP